jgi:TatD DNase family protein
MKEISYFDIGANLTHESFKKDLDIVIKEAKLNKVKKICITSTTIEDTKISLKISEKEQDFFITTCGIHPHYADTFKESNIKEIKQLSEHTSVKAIGETGLDFNRNFSKKENQILCFKSQIEIAQELNLNLFLHQRDAHKDFMNCFNNVDLKVNAVVHCFTEDKEKFYEYLDRGFWIGFTGWICDPVRGKHMIDLISNMPLDRIMIETDSPYLMPKNLKIKGRRNEPKFIVEVAKRIASLQNKSLEDISQIFFENSLKFFDL